MICFFDPAHGTATVNVMWMPQWGVQRPIEVCQFCAQRIQTTQPPFYTPQQQGYPQQQQGYPQQQGGFYGNAQDQWGNPAQGRPQGQGHSTGALIGAGAAGLVGGMVLGEMMADDDDDDRRGYREDRDDFGGGDFGGGDDDGGFGDVF